MTKTRWLVVGLVCLAAAAVGTCILQSGFGEIPPYDPSIRIPSIPRGL